MFQSIVTVLDELLVDHRSFGPRLLRLSHSVVWNLNRLPIHFYLVVLIVRSVTLRGVDWGKDVIALSILHILKLGFCIFCLDRKRFLRRSEIWRLTYLIFHLVVHVILLLWRRHPPRDFLLLLLSSTLHRIDHSLLCLFFKNLLLRLNRLPIFLPLNWNPLAQFSAPLVLLHYGFQNI